MSNPSYEKFIARVREVKRLSSVGAVLHWDQETYMPPKALAFRAEQLSLLSGLVHERMVSDEMGELLESLSSGDGLSEVAQANVREVRRAYERERKLPVELVQELSRTQSLAHEAWVSARKSSDFGKFAPWLEKIVTLRRKGAALVAGVPEHGDAAALYDALLDEYEPGAKSRDIQAVFLALRQELVPLVQKIAASGKSREVLPGKYSQEKQREFSLSVAKAMGFDFEAGRLDVSTHPFCISFGPRDVRMTTRYDENDFTGALFSVMHETGHALYEQGFDPEHAATPMAEAISMGIHESQSRLWENMVGRSKAFWTQYYSRFQATFPEALRDVPFERFYRAINVVEPSMIRTESDEVTYNLHILLRFELEQSILSGATSVSALPGIWNRKMEEYLGICPKNDAEGVLQDIHWSMGAFGYFPTYALGNLYAAQFFAAARREISDLEGKISRGEFLPLRDWLREKIHRHGQRYRAGEVCELATGERLNAQHFNQYLKAKFGELYGV